MGTHSSVELDRMKGSIGLLVGLCFSSITSFTIWEDGKEYHFLEESAIHVGTNDLDSSASGFRMMSDVKVQVSGNKLVVSIDNVHEAHYSHSYPKGGWPYRLHQEKIKDPKSKYIPSVGYENGNTFSVTLENGLIASIDLPDTLSLNGKNMMRALASILQIDLSHPDSQMGMWRKMERSIHGECKFEYAFLKSEHPKLMEVSKTVSHINDCVKRNFKLFDNSDAYSCNGVTHDLYTGMNLFGKQLNDEQRDEIQHKMYRPEPIHSTSMTTFQLKEIEPKKFNVEKVFSAGSVVVQRFSEEGPTHATIANRTLTLVEVKDTAELRPVQNPKTYQDLEFEWMEGNTFWNAPLTIDDLKKKESFFYNGYILDESQDNLMETLKRKVSDHVDEMKHFQDPHLHKEETIRNLHQHSIQSLLPFFHGLNHDSLLKLKTYYLGLRTDIDDKKAMRDIFFEMLPLSGTWPAALVVHEIVMNNELKSDMETARIITSLPFHVESVKLLVEEFFKIVMSDKHHLHLPLTKSAMDLAYAHLVRRTCHDITTQQECFNALHVEEFINRFDTLSVEDHTKLQHLMHVFFNLRDSEILEHKMKDIIFNKTPKRYHSAIKTQAIFALASRALKKGVAKDYFLPIFLTREESHEVRIAAFDILMREMPSTTTLNKIMTYTIYETDYEVFNYVFTAFEKFATQTNEPCRHILHKYAKYFIKYWKNHMWQKPKYTVGLSKTFVTSFNQEKYGYAGSVEVHTVGSHKTSTPLHIMVDVRAQRYQHITMEVFGVSIRMEGVAEKIVDKVKEFVSSGTFEFEKLKEILFTDMSIRQRATVPAKLDFVLMMRNNVVFEYHLMDADIIGMFGKLKEYFNQLINLQDVFKFNKHLGLAWDMFLYEQPTDFGVPMAYASGAASILGFQGEMKKDIGLHGEIDMHMHMNTHNVDMMTFIHPDQKVRFSIQHDRAYKHQLKTSLTTILDYNNRKLLVALKVPEIETPLSLLGHSQTFIYTGDNKIIGDQIYLRKSCPTCLMKQVISHGKDHRVYTDLLRSEYHEAAHIYGLEVAGRLFDCEIPEVKSSGQRFFTFMRAFNPLSYESKGIFNILVGGLHRLHAFLFYLPRIESCGAHLLLSQSTMDPVDDLIFEIDLKNIQLIDGHHKIMGEKRIALAGNLIFSGAVNRTHHIELEYVVAPMWTKSHLDIDIRRKPFMYGGRHYPEYPIVFRMKTRYADTDRPIMFKDLISVERHTVHTNIEVSWGKLDNKIQIEGDHKTTTEAIDTLHTKWYYNKCIQDHTMPDWQHSEAIPTTDACLYTLHDLLTLRHYKWDITATNLPPWMVYTYKKMGALLKTSLFPFWEFTPEYSTHEISPRQPTIRIEQIFRTKEEVFDLTLEVEKDVSKFMGVNYGLLHWNVEPYLSLSKLTFLTRAMIQPELMTYMYYNNIINHCHATRHHIRTYDNVTYPYTMDHSCWTLISSDCYEHPSFGVFVKKAENALIGLMAFIGDQKVEIIPVDANQIMIKINDQEHEILDNGVLFWPTTRVPHHHAVFREYLFKIIRHKNTFILDFFPQIMINFNGISAQVLAGPHIKGQNCGMCGDYNRNPHHEFLDPQMCHLKNGDEMALAWTLDTKFCTDTITKPACTKIKV